MSDIVNALRAEAGGFSGTGDSMPLIAFSSKDYAQDAAEGVSPTLRAQNHDKSHINGGGQVAVASQYNVRRLTPTECERLQGFPDEWTAMHSDSVRYHQLGNAVAVPVAEWIGRRLQSVTNPTGKTINSCIS